MKERIFKGAATALITPFNEQGINFQAFEQMIENQIREGIDALVITGTTGESSTMTDEEHKEAIRFAVEKVKRRIPVIAGTGSNETGYAIQLSRYAESVGADGLLLVTPYYNKCTQRGLIEHYTAIAEHVTIPCILYNVPSRTGVNIQVATYAELAKHPRIVAVKEASGDISAVVRIRRACGDALDIYSGNDDQIVPMLSLGAQGVISVLSNVMPNLVHRMCDLYFQGKVSEAAKLQIDYMDFIDVLFSEVNPIPVKTAMREMGYDAGSFRLPLCEMESANAEKLKKVMKKYNLIKE